MRYILLFPIILATTVFSHAQKFRELTPARGHYKQLSAFDTKPSAGGEELDKKKFPFRQAEYDRRLSLKPYYLSNVTLDDFKMPDPPANSSEQTRAELDYMLALQAQRTKLDVESSLY